MNTIKVVEEKGFEKEKGSNVRGEELVERKGWGRGEGWYRGSDA